MRVLPVLLVLIAACSNGPVADMDALSIEIDRLVAAHDGAVVAVSIRDGSGGVVFDRNGDRLFHAASTMKIPVMIEVFRQARAGELALTDSLVVRNSFRSIVDSSVYAIEDDTDDGIYTVLGERMNVRDLVHSMITISSNLATNLLIDTVDAERVQATTEAMGTTGMQTLRGVEDLKAFELGMSNRTTSADLALLLDAIAEGRAVSAQDDEEMVSILLDQELNEMIPAGLPDGVRVAHKTGQITEIHHDAAIVYPDGGAPYVLVILIEGIADDTVSAALGSEIAATVHRAIRPAS